MVSAGLKGRLHTGVPVATMIENTLKYLNLEDGRGIRYTRESIIHWLCARFVGGSASNNFRRGEATAGAGNKGGHLPIDVSRLYNVEASRATLQAWTLPAEVYRSIQDAVKDAIAALPAGVKDVGIALDALYLNAGLAYLPSLGLIVGMTSKAAGGLGAIPVKDARKHTAVELAPNIATQVEQFFVVSTDGRAAVPLNYVAQQGERGKMLFHEIEAAATLFRAAGIKVSWVSTDGFTSSEDLDARLAKMPEEIRIHHIYDYQHLLKVIRNLLLNKTFPCKIDNKTVHISMNKLDTIRTTIASALKKQPLDSTENTKVLQDFLDHVLEEVRLFDRVSAHS
jgi:hypothetical protein